MTNGTSVSGLAHSSNAVDTRRTAELRSSNTAERKSVAAEPHRSVATVAHAEAAPLVTAPERAATAAGERSRSQARVDGFGAEGAVLDEAEAKGSGRIRSGAARSSAAPEPPALTAAEQAELTDEAVQPVVLPGLYSRTGRLVMPAPLKGSHEVLVHQNQMADQAGLERIQDDAMLDRLRAAHELVNLPESRSLHVNENLPFNRRYARPWTARFANDIAQQFYMRFHEPLQLNSAVRTVDYQLRLQRVNGNAAAVDGNGASPHLTGQAIDFGKRGMSLAEIAWMRAYLLPLIEAGRIDVEEEFQQACFHISVYRSYAPGRRRSTLRTEQAQLQDQPQMERPVTHSQTAEREDEH